MKKIFKFTSIVVVATLVALLLKTLIGWSLSISLVLGAALSGIVYLAWILRATHPRITRMLLVVGGLIVASQIVALWLGSAFPLTRETLPYAIGGRDVQMSQTIDRGLAKAKTAVLIKLQEQEDKTEKELSRLMDKGDYDGVTNTLAKRRAIREKIETAMMRPSPPPTPSPVKATPATTSSGKSLTVELQPDQVYDIDDLITRQHWRYTAFNGAFEHRIDKGDGQACWKVMDNNLPWNADYAGKLQVKAGNMSVKLTVNIFSP